MSKRSWTLQSSKPAIGPYTSFLHVAAPRASITSKTTTMAPAILFQKPGGAILRSQARCWTCAFSLAEFVGSICGAMATLFFRFRNSSRELLESSTEVLTPWSLVLETPILELHSRVPLYPLRTTIELVGFQSEQSSDIEVQVIRSIPFPACERMGDIAIQRNLRALGNAAFVHLATAVLQT
ncbi:hypothetical protein BDZ45DRAFT_751356 [Acephala macrosclerotiorum]|nr:hypothetical protein BDZ45DRAFT_751356 [Acephala macrosclerotiorum]